MSCPFFYPREPLDETRWRTPRPLPLGDAYDGDCRAVDPPSHPTDEQLKLFCNLGYARGRCPRFPGTHPVDATRFGVSADRDGRIVIAYAQERDHRPQAHGRLEYDQARGVFSEPHPDPIIQEQARSYLAAYVRRKSTPGGVSADKDGASQARP